MSEKKRVIVWVDGGIADARMDDGVEWNLIDFDVIEDGGEQWTKQEVDELEKWGKGLIGEAIIERLRDHVSEQEEDE